jgi:hypothetical protein
MEPDCLMLIPAVFPGALIQLLTLVLCAMTLLHLGETTDSLTQFGKHPTFDLTGML